MSTSTINIVLEESVKKAILSGQPVVALESTIIAHGMPYPQNLETAILLENKVREHGAIPATCAVINGVCKAGLNAEELKILATQKCMKLSRRDLPLAIMNQSHGATTVAATMILAEAAGIKVFATGGVGGVHRNYASTLDISADMIELSKTNVAVISAGCKSILDIPNTLELLETLSVPVIGYQSKEFPAFYSRTSGYPSPMTLNSSSEIAEFLKLKWGMGLNGGVLVANPIPKEMSLDAQKMEKLIEKSLTEASAQGISGKDLTPFLLTRLVEFTEGASLQTNIALAMNNAELAAKIAVDWSKLN